MHRRSHHGRCCLALHLGYYLFARRREQQPVLGHGCLGSAKFACVQRQKPATFAQMPLFVYRHFTGAICTSSDGRLALFSARSTPAFSLASRLSNSLDILLSRDIFRAAPHCRRSPTARSRTVLSRSDPVLRFVFSRQTFVRRCLDGKRPHRSQRQPHQNHATRAASQMATATPRIMTSNRDRLAASSKIASSKPRTAGHVR